MLRLLRGRFILGVMSALRRGLAGCLRWIQCCVLLSVPPQVGVTMVTNEDNIGYFFLSFFFTFFFPKFFLTFFFFPEILRIFCTCSAEWVFSFHH